MKSGSLNIFSSPMECAVDACHFIARNMLDLFDSILQQTGLFESALN